MSEIRKQLTEYQFVVLVELDKEVAQAKMDLERAQAKMQVSTNLILDSHDCLGKQVTFDPKTKELVITDAQ